MLAGEGQDGGKSIPRRARLFQVPPRFPGIPRCPRIGLPEIPALRFAGRAAHRKNGVPGVVRRQAQSRVSRRDTQNPRYNRRLALAGGIGDHRVADAANAAKGGVQHPWSDFSKCDYDVVRQGHAYDRLSGILPPPQPSPALRAREGVDMCRDLCPERERNILHV